MSHEFIVRSDQENLQMLVQVLEVLRTGLDSYKGGTASSWMIISARLYQLLTDKAKRRVPLLFRVIPGLTLHPMQHSLKDSKLVYFEAIPVPISFSENAVTLSPFDTAKLRMPFDEWLNQVAYIKNGVSISLEDLQKKTRNRLGGGHFDVRVDQNTQAIETILDCVRIPEGSLSFRDYLFSIGEYIHYLATTQLMLGVANGHRTQGNFELAQEFYQAAILKAEEKEDLQSQVEILTAFSFLESARCNLDSGASLASRSYEIGVRMDWDEGARSAALNASVLHYRSGFFLSDEAPDTAIDQYKRAARFAVAIEDWVQLQAINVNLGQLYLRASALQPLLAVLVVSGLLPCPAEDDPKAAEICSAIDHLISKIDLEDPQVLKALKKIHSDSSTCFAEAVGCEVASNVNLVDDPLDILRDAAKSSA